MADSAPNPIAAIAQMMATLADVENQITDLEARRKGLRARLLDAMDAIGADSIELEQGIISRASRPRELALTMSDRDFATRWPQLCKPDPKAIRKARAKNPELWEVAIDQPSPGYSLRFKQSK